MSGNNYASMADLFGATFDGKKVAILPIDHGGAVQADALEPYLHRAGVKFVMYERKGATKPEEHCIDQGNLHLYEVRQIITPRRRVRQFLRNSGTDEIVWLDDWATKRTMPSIGGAWAYSAICGYPNARTAAFQDYCGGVDISPDRRSDRQYAGTRDYIRQNDPNIYYYLLANGRLSIDENDWLFARVLEQSSWFEKARLYAIRRVDQLLVTPLARRIKRNDFVKDSTDRMLKMATML